MAMVADNISDDEIEAERGVEAEGSKRQENEVQLDSNCTGRLMQKTLLSGSNKKWNNNRLFVAL